MVDLRIIFMGTPDFAVASLAALVENSMPVVAVITAPDRKKGRGQSLIPSPVKEYALAKEIPVLQPTNLKSEDFLRELKSFDANLQVVVAFRMLPEVVWAMPTLGTFNLHASLLPNYRGAAPINWAIINGEKETGVTTFYLKHEIDTGSIIFQEKEEININDTVGDLYLRLMEKGSQLVVQTVKAIANENVETYPQNEENAYKTAPKIFKDTCKIDWQSDAESIHNFIRGLNPYPAAWTEIDNVAVKIFKIQKTEIRKDMPTGSYLTDHKSQLLVKTGDSWVEILEIQFPGKKKMLIADLLRGNSLSSIETL